MFACLAADYPRDPRAGEPDVLGEADRRLAAGEISEADHEAVIRDVVKVVLAEQEASGLAVLTDGAVAHADRLAMLVEGLGGASSQLSIALPDGATSLAPRFDRAVEWRGPITVGAWRAADKATDLIVKQVVVGPFTMARLSDAADASRSDLALALAEAMNAELRALADAGCPVIQVDEGALTTIGADADAWRLYGETQRRLTAGLEDHHLSLGLYRGAADPAGHATILDGPYRSYLVDALGGPDAWRFAFAVPPERGLIVGALDAAQEVRDETEVMVWAMAWAAERDRAPERIGVASNGSLRAIGRHAARRKIELMGEAVGIAAMGPLREVAEALDPAPGDTRMAPLRQLAEAVEAARTPA
jgi:methionine synthase II (cobalamin-independent)